MRDGEVCVCFFAETLETNNPKISRHLSYLKRAKLVAGRRDGKWMHYRIVEPKDKGAAEVFSRVMEMLDKDKEMQIDRKNLAAVCCAPQLIGISSARKSNITEAVAKKGLPSNFG